MNILVVGNGFDLAHGLATSYSDCLKFFEMALRCINKETYKECRSILWRDPSRRDSSIMQFNDAQIEFLKDILSESDAKNALFCECIQNNLWIEHFLNKQNSSKDEHHKWIDFEAEISRVVQATESRIKELCDKFITVEQMNPEFFDQRDIRRYPHFQKTGEKIAAYIRIKSSSSSLMEHVSYCIVELLYRDLLKLTTAVEIYIKTCTISGPTKILCDLDGISIDKVISFNYTNTFQRYMKRSAVNSEDICHIHGKIRDSIDDNNSPIVLGINEYCEKKHQDQDVTWVMFKKSFQRIFKHTDYQYVAWRDDSKTSNLYIIGHSLDITDGDILRELIVQPYRFTTVYYRSDKQLSAEIVNLIQILGDDGLNMRARSVPPTIIFKKQEPPLDVSWPFS